MSRIVALGEIMLRLKAPGHERLLQSPFLEASFGGAEANVAVSLAGFGLECDFVTALPDNDLGDAALAELRRFGVGTSQIVRDGERLGIYFLESGVNQRASRVVYDRAGSAIATIDPGRFDWPAILADATWLHVTGITPALSATAAELTLAACREARRQGLTISCDMNFRASLWRYGRAAPDVMTDLFGLVDVGIGGREDCQRALGIGIDPGSPDPKAFETLTDAVMRAFPNLSTLAITLRDARSASHHGWSACLRTAEGFVMAPGFEITQIVDRIGTGDAFAAGLIFGLEAYDDAADALAFATAAGCLKHGISGDFNRVGLAEVEDLMRGNFTGRVRR